MADIAVSFAIEQLLPLLIKEGKKLKGIHKEFADIKDELESIQSFLKDADRKAAAEKDNQDEGIKTWVKQVREAAFRIEDIVDEYMVYVGQRHLDTGSAVSLTKVPHFIKTLIPRHDIASKIQEIKSHVREIKSRAERYDFQREPLSSKQESSKTRVGQNVEWNDPRMAALYLQEAELVGFEAPRNELIGWLTKGKAERTVISVVAMGGQGKTTLAKKVFDNKNVVDHFDFHVWITVSQSYTVEGLLRNILEKLCEERMEEPPQNILQMDRDSLTNKVRSYLNGFWSSVISSL